MKDTETTPEVCQGLQGRMVCPDFTKTCAPDDNICKFGEPVVADSAVEVQSVSYPAGSRGTFMPPNRRSLTGRNFI